MKVIIFNLQSSFQSVIYNISKVTHDKAELMDVRNFQALALLQQVTPNDYINYLRLHSKPSTSKKPQFHASIICDSTEKNKQQLTEITHKWLEKMGYKNQPYLIFFHNDTQRNHTHIVSSRINSEGVVIKHGYEMIYALSKLDEVLGIDPKKQVEQDIKQALSFNYSSPQEFAMLLSEKKYRVQLKDNSLKLSRHGIHRAQIELSTVLANIKPASEDTQRILYLKELFYKMKEIYDPRVIRSGMSLKNAYDLGNKFSSEFTKAMSANFNISIYFLGKNNLIPSEYKIIDHSSHQIFHGKSIMPIQEFISPIRSIARDIKHTQKVAPELALANSLQYQSSEKSTIKNSITDFRLAFRQASEAMDNNQEKRKRGLRI